MNESNMDNGRLESLLKITAQRLGSTPEELKRAAQNGTLSKLLGNVAEGGQRRPAEGAVGPGGGEEAAGDAPGAEAFADAPGRKKIT